MLFGIFNQDSLKKFTTLCLVFASLVIVSNIALLFTGSNKLPEDSIVLYAQKSTKLYMPFGGHKGDTVTSNISRGDSVWLLGVETDKLRYWVADAQGQRGYVNQEDFDSCVVIHSMKRVDEKIKPFLGDTVQIVKPLRKRGEFLCRLSNDSTIEVSAKYIFGSTAIKYEKYITKGNYTTHMSMKRLERELKTSNIVSADSIGKLARVIAKTKSGWLARYNITAVGSDGVKYYPIVAFDSNGQFSKVDMKVKTSSGSFLLSLLPFVDTIADSGFLESLIDEPIYNFSFNVSEYPAWLYYICWVLVLLFGLFVFLMWVQGTALFPMFLMMGMPWWMSLPLLLVAAAYPLSEYVGNLADNVTTTRWSDGRTTQDITDKQHHVKVDNIYQYDVYKVKYLVHDIYDHYVCHHCKHDERSYNPKYEELSREYLRSYTGY